MKEIQHLMSYRESIKVVDATLRDGGLCNDFYFTDEFVKNLYKTNIEAGVDYMELGYRASKKVFDESKFGKWKFCSDDHIREVIGDNSGTNLKLAIMADIGRHDKDDFDQFMEKVRSIDAKKPFVCFFSLSGYTKYVIDNSEGVQLLTIEDLYL